ncbi:MAG: radical SAM protein [Eubacteriales bacterium]|nr:radical SAM protein [Eubacteriales bacterium]
MNYHFKEAKSLLSAHNGINIYRGCTHGCIYCDSRSLCYNMDHIFEDIEVKSNAIQLFEAALKSKRSPCMISTGSMSDPYMPLESELGYTRKCLELAEKYGFGFTLITKSDAVLRDLDLLKRINKKAKCVVQMTLTTYDEALCRIIEPCVCTTKARFEALKVLRDNGIPTVVWLTPTLPFINDTEENLRGILNYCAEAMVYGIINFGFGVTLRNGDREYFYEKLDEHFPGMKAKYSKAYGDSYEVMSADNEKLTKIFNDKCAEHKIILGNDEIFAFLHEFPRKYEQMSLF